MGLNSKNDLAAAADAPRQPSRSLRPSVQILLFRLPVLLRWVVLAAAALLLLFGILWVAFPFPREELSRYPTGSVLLDREGVPLRMRLGPNDTDCRLRYHPDVDHDWICKAVVAAEDHRFWSHHGVDPAALGRAVLQNVMYHRRVSGASTISTQVIRLMHPRRRTLRAKIIESFRALQLERLLGKKEILEQYLNRAPFGANLIGIEAASRRYLGKNPGELSLAEAALLAGLPQSPSRLRPDRSPERSRRRQAYVLERMGACGMITEAQRVSAVAQPIVLKRDAYPFRAPHFCDIVPELDAATATIRTTLDPALQRLAESTLERHARELCKVRVYGGAVVIIEVKTGAVRALVGSPDYDDLAHAGKVNGAVAPRSAGSSLKPFVYAMALDRGRLTPGLALADVPRVFKDYTPVNFDGTFTGIVPAREALAMSLNIPALTLVEREGVVEFLGTLRRLGFGTLNKSAATYGLGLALGNGPVRLLDLANAYACFARGGEWRPCTVREGAVKRGTAGRVFSREASWLIADMLSGDERSGDTTGHRADVRLPQVAWKTGTSSGFRDAWAVGFNPEYVVGVWLGNPDGQPMAAEPASRSAVPVMWDIFRGIYPANDAPWFKVPDGLKKRLVCSVSGQPAGSGCPATIEDWAIKGVSSAVPCSVHRASTGQGVVTESWPPEVQAFLRKQRAASTSTNAVSEAPMIRLISPISQMTYRKLDDERFEQRLPLKAEGGGPGPYYWFVDNQLVATVPPTESASWSLVPGKHTVVCSTAAGRSAKAEIVVE